jgi:hypothetical protein
MHDRQYRLAIAWQNVAYNQPPHPSFFVGKSMFIPDSLKPPCTPINIRGVAWDDTCLIQWDANVDADLAGYVLYRGKSTNNFTDSIDVGNTTSYLDTAVTNDTTYYYAVAAYDFDGNKSEYSEIIEVTPTVRPAIPTGISYRFDTNSIMLIWDTQDFENISGINIYRAETEEMNFELITTLNKSISAFIDEGLTNGKTYYYELSVTDTNSIESFPTDIQSITPGSSFTFQSEDATLIGTVYVESNHLGYHGTAFTNFETSNSTVEFTNMPGFGGGDRTLIFRYALGNTDRTGNLIVNGNTQSLTMHSTGEWTNYVYDSVGVTLNAGYDNTISFATTGNDFGNLDEIIIVPRAITDVAYEDNKDNIPTEFQLYQNYPNPFNPFTTIAFDLAQAGPVTLKIYDVMGREVAALVDKNLPAGKYQYKLNASNYASGVYFYHLTAGNWNETHKMVLAK